MPTNYDAKAVAEVMGLAFLRSETTELSSAPATKAAGKPAAGKAKGDFVIQVDGEPMHIVEIGPDDSLAPFRTPGRSRVNSAALKLQWVRTPSAVFIEKAVEKGLPRNALRHLAEWLAGDDRAKITTLEWGVVPKTTLERRETQLSLQESERTERVARLIVHARRALGSEEEAREFMTTPHPELDGRRPIDAAKTDLGTRRTEQILNALEYGLAL